MTTLQFKALQYKVLESRVLNNLVFVSAAGLMATALFFEHAMGLAPCPLCITQRIVVVALGLTGLTAALHNPTAKGYRRYGVALTTLGILGIGLAIRQLYIQSLPPGDMPACLPGLDYLIEVMPLTDLLVVMFSGTGDCAEVQWTLLGLSIPGWTLLCFLGYSALGLFEVMRHRILPQ